MIKFIAQNKQDNTNTLFIGLSQMNISKLQENLPIKINVKEVMKMAPVKIIEEIFIFVGDTEESMIQDLKDNFEFNTFSLRKHHDK